MWRFCSEGGKQWQMSGSFVKCRVVLKWIVKCRCRVGVPNVIVNVTSRVFDGCFWRGCCVMGYFGGFSRAREMGRYAAGCIKGIVKGNLDTCANVWEMG
jgi:hypothetical protein